jgi:hypothetical protein
MAIANSYVDKLPKTLPPQIFEFATCFKSEDSPNAVAHRTAITEEFLPSVKFSLTYQRRRKLFFDIAPIVIAILQVVPLS